jgi:hypothetical protein
MIRGGTQQYQSIDLARLGMDRRVSRGASSHAATNDGNAPRPILAEVVNCREDIEVKGRIHGIGIAGTMGLAITAEIDRQYVVSSVSEYLGLLRPTFLSELASVRKYYTLLPNAVFIAENNSHPRLETKQFSEQLLPGKEKELPRLE